jgi:hypothetical protein
MRLTSMNIKKLKELIANMPDEALVLVPDSDHSYRVPNVNAGTAIRNKAGDYIYEDHGDENKDFKQDVRIDALIIE